MDCVFIKEIIKLLLNPMKEALQDEEIFKKFQDLSYNYWTKLQSTSWGNADYFDFKKNSYKNNL